MYSSYDSEAHITATQEVEGEVASGKHNVDKAISLGICMLNFFLAMYARELYRCSNSSAY